MATDTDKTAKKRSGVAKSPGPHRTKKSERRLEKYNQVIENVQLLSVQLIESEFKVRREFLSMGTKGRKKLEYNVTPGEIFFDAESGNGAIKFSCEAFAKAGRVKAVSCKAVYAVVYENLHGCDEEAASAFLKRIGRYTCYPYFRALFGILNGEAQTHMPPLPVLKEPIGRPTKAAKSKNSD